MNFEIGDEIITDCPCCPPTEGVVMNITKGGAESVYTILILNYDERRMSTRWESSMVRLVARSVEIIEL